MKSASFLPLLPFVVASVLGPGCAEDFAPITLLDSTRLLAIPSDPLELELGESITLRAIGFVPSNASVAAARWSFCPLTTGSRGGYACLAPACETELAPRPDGSVVAEPTALALACVTQLQQAGTLPTSTTSTTTALPEEVETVFRVTLEATDGTRDSGLARIKLYPRGAPAPRNRPPRITGVRFAGTRGSSTTPALSGTLSRAAQLTVVVEVDPDSLDMYTDTAGRERKEDAVVSYFSTTGRWSSERSAGTTSQSDLEPKELAASDTGALIYIVVRDDRGGQDFAGPYRVAIGP